MTIRIFQVSCLVGAFLLGCNEAPDVASPPPIVSVSGTYQVEGVTTEVTSGNTRKISGKVILRQEGNRYVATFDLDTAFPNPDGMLQVDVVGTGVGVVEGSTLTGTADTQLIAPLFGGVDPQFPFTPQVFSRQLRSTFTGTIDASGALDIRLRNEAVEGQEYAETRTHARGVRIGPMPQRAGAPAAPADPSQP